MPHGRVDIIFARLTRGYHISILELHRLCTLCPELTTHNDLHAVMETLSDMNERCLSCGLWFTIKVGEENNNQTNTDLASLRPALHNKSKNTIASSVQMKRKDKPIKKNRDVRIGVFKKLPNRGSS